MLKTFEELGVIPNILKAIKEIGYTVPMPIQEKVIPYLLGNGNEIIALAQTGTGKTAAFGIPVIQQIILNKLHPQSLILCPTRELCCQIAKDLNNYSKYIEGLKIFPVYGGVDIKNQIKIIKKGVHVIVATPGRLLDLIHRCMICLQNIKNIILDEADEMLNMGFSESIDEILKYIPKTRNIFLFSATMPVEISRIIKKYMSNPYEVLVGKKNEGAENIRHIYYLINVSDKYLLLKRLIDYYPNIYGIIFCRTKNETQDIADLLLKDGHNVDSLHGDLSQAQRANVMKKFRLKHFQLLVATDVAARGLDVNNLTHIIHYGLPNEVDSYIHRSGRTGRAGKTGISIAILYLRDKYKIKIIEKSIYKTFERGIIPSWEEIYKNQLFYFFNKLTEIKLNDIDVVDEIFSAIYLQLDGVSKEDLIKRLVLNEFKHLIDYYQKVKVINSPTGKEKNNKENIKRTIRDFSKQRYNGNKRYNSNQEYIRLFINIGKFDGLTPKALIGIFDKNIPGRKVEIGTIKLMWKFSFFEVKKGDMRTVIHYLNGIESYKKTIIVENIKKYHNIND